MKELEHQRELERRKLLFGLRSEIYLKITQVFADAVTALSASHAGPAGGPPETVAELAGALRRLQDLVTSCVVIASEEVRVAHLSRSRRSASSRRHAGEDAFTAPCISAGIAEPRS